MLRIALALALGFSVVALANSSVTADDKKAESKTDAKGESKTLEGKLVCSKCKLAETDKCGNALLVKEGGKDVTYFLNDKGAKEKYHQCTGEADAKVVGKVLEKENRKLIDDPKVEKKAK